MSAALTTNVDQRLLRTTKFPPEFNVKVDMRKVHTDLIKAWVDSEISKILKSEDDVVSDLVKNILDESRFVSALAQYHMSRGCGFTDIRDSQISRSYRSHSRASLTKMRLLFAKIYGDFA